MRKPLNIMFSLHRPDPVFHLVAGRTELELPERMEALDAEDDTDPSMVCHL